MGVILLWAPQCSVECLLSTLRSD